MRAMVLRRYGGPDVLEPAELPDPEPGDDETLVRLEASAVNPIDLGVRRGDVLPDEPSRFPMVLGWDGVGRLVDGPDAGRRVLCFSALPASGVGLHAGLATPKRARVVPLPDALPTNVAVCLPLAGVTALDGLAALKVENAASADKLALLVELALGGTLAPWVEAEHRLEALGEAHAALERPGVHGRHVLVH